MIEIGIVLKNDQSVGFSPEESEVEAGGAGDGSGEGAGVGLGFTDSG